MSYKRMSDTEWVWKHESRNYSVRIFPKLNTVIWSSWVNTAEGPQYDDGVRQQLPDFASNGVPIKAAIPDALLMELRQSVAKLTNADDRSRGGLLGWMRRGESR